METGEKARNVEVPIRKKISHQKQRNHKSGSQDAKESGMYFGRGYIVDWCSRLKPLGRHPL